jgi:hypothetical protein
VIAALTARHPFHHAAPICWPPSTASVFLAAPRVDAFLDRDARDERLD